MIFVLLYLRQLGLESHQNESLRSVNELVVFWFHGQQMFQSFDPPDVSQVENSADGTDGLQS